MGEIGLNKKVHIANKIINSDAISKIVISVGSKKLVSSA
jgi:hypothetical protein